MIKDLRKDIGDSSKKSPETSDQGQMVIERRERN